MGEDKAIRSLVDRFNSGNYEEEPTLSLPIQKQPKQPKQPKPKQPFVPRIAEISRPRNVDRLAVLNDRLTKIDEKGEIRGSGNRSPVRMNQKYRDLFVKMAKECEMDGDTKYQSLFNMAAALKDGWMVCVCNLAGCCAYQRRCKFCKPVAEYFDKMGQEWCIGVDSASSYFGFNNGKKTAVVQFEKNDVSVKTICKFGENCKYFKTNSCTFYHPPT